jgi:hypothetical protein
LLLLNIMRTFCIYRLINLIKNSLEKLFILITHFLILLPNLIYFIKNTLMFLLWLWCLILNLIKINNINRFDISYFKNKLFSIYWKWYGNLILLECWVVYFIWMWFPLAWLAHELVLHAYKIILAFSYLLHHILTCLL